MLKKLTGLALITFGLLAGASSASAQDVIITADSTISQGSNESVFLFAEDPQQRAIDVVEFTLIVGDGGSFLGNTTTEPAIVGINNTGLTADADTFFADLDMDPSTGTFDESPFAIIGTFVLFDSTLTTSPQAFAEVSFDTSGLSAGDSFELSLEGGGRTSQFGLDGSPIAVDFPTSFTITVEAVPEPSSLILLASFGTLALVRRKRA